MIDERERYERAFDLFEMPEPAFERMQGRRDRRRRNQRLAAGALGLVVALAATLFVGRLLRTAPPDRDIGTTPSPAPTQPSWPGIWPFASRAEAAEAQDGADRGNPTFTWLLGEGDQSQYGEGDVVAKRFVREQLGWESFRVVDGGWSGSVANLRFIRCEPGGANATYPEVPCAPIEGNRFETIVVRMEQPFRTGLSGIWVITRWKSVPAFEQTVRPTTEEVRALVMQFMETRVRGSGAETFLLDPTAISLLYETTGGDPFTSFSVGSISGPDWPAGDLHVGIRLSAGDVVVRQTLSLRRTDEGLQIGNGGYTTENGEAVR